MSVFIIILQLHHEKGAGDMRRPQKTLGYRTDEEVEWETFLEGGCTLKLYWPLAFNCLFFRSENKTNDWLHVKKRTTVLVSLEGDVSNQIKCIDSFYTDVLSRHFLFIMFS